MVSSAFVLAFVTSGAFMAIYAKLPKKVRAFMEKHSLLTDACAMIATYLLLGGTLTALTAGAIVGLTTSGLLHVAKHQEDFQYLVVAKDKAVETIGNLSSKLNVWAKQFRKEKITPAENFKLTAIAA